MASHPSLPPSMTHPRALEDFEPVKKPKRNKFAFACAILASMTSILLGYNIGVMSGAIIYIQEDLDLTDVQIEILFWILSVYSLIGSLAAGRTSDRIGRRYTIVLAGAIFFAGALLMGFATNYTFLMFGRFVAGIGVGYGLMIAPVYTAEVSPASTRGFLTSFPEVFINVGILLGYISNYAFSKLPLYLGWRMMLGIGAIPSIFLVLGVLAMPETPQWLVMQGRLGDARKVLDKTSDSKEEASLRLSEIKQAAGIPEHETNDVVSVSASRSHGEGVWRELIISPTPSIRHIVIAGVGIHFFQQISGIDAVVLYSARIFIYAGINIISDDQQLLATVAVGFVKTIFILIATFNLDRYGRRPLLLTSVTGLILSLLTLATSLTIISYSFYEIPSAMVISILAVLAFVATFSIGMGPITWVYSSEIFPLRLRAQGTSIGVAVNRLTSGVISMTFIYLSEAITIGGAFYLFAGISIVAWCFFFTLLPETRGKTLEEMQVLFEKMKNRGDAADVAQEVQLAGVDEIGSADILQLDFGTVRAATNNFSDDNKLGQGGFGSVYKGKLADGHEIAVKRLATGSGQGDLEFKNEVVLVAKLQHRNLVRLLGFCSIGQERLLIYKFVANGSLDQFLFDPYRRSYLDWERRNKIIGGVARGLLYLHEDSRLRIIHRDLKASNILLDEEMHPKIADFGMARLCIMDQTQGNTNRIVGTYGYMAPEYAMHGQFSVKSDVYSFGVLLLELVSGQKNSCFRVGETAEYLISFAWDSWRSGSAANMIDPVIINGPRNEIMRCIHIGLLCVQESVTARPTMASVVMMLNSFLVALPPPSEPAFYMHMEAEQPMLAGSSNSKCIFNNFSKNEVSITEMEPR